MTTVSATPRPMLFPMAALAFATCAALFVLLRVTFAGTEIAPLLGVMMWASMAGAFFSASAFTWLVNRAVN